MGLENDEKQDNELSMLLSDTPIESHKGWHPELERMSIIAEFSSTSVSK